MPDDVIDHAPDSKAPESGATMGAHDDHVAPDDACSGHDGVARVTVPDVDFRIHAVPADPVRDCLKVRCECAASGTLRLAGRAPNGFDFEVDDVEEVDGRTEGNRQDLRMAECNGSAGRKVRRDEDAPRDRGQGHGSHDPDIARRALGFPEPGDQKDRTKSVVRLPGLMSGDETDDLRRMVREAADAAKAAQKAAERVTADEPSRFERILEAIRDLLGTFADLLMGRLRVELTNARRSGEDLVARTLRAVSRSLTHVLDAAILAAGAWVLLTVGIVTFAVALSRGLDHVLGEPWGTAATGALFLAGSGIAWSLARARLKAVAEEGWRVKDA